MDLNTTRNTALSIIAKARTQLREIARNDLQITKKADNSFVTRADKETEKLIRRELENAFPNHNILGEEFPSIEKGASHTWVIDPIDGTHSFRHGIPLYGTMLCLLEDDKPLVSVVDLPGLDRCYSAAKGHGAFVNNEQIILQALTPDELIADEVIATGERLQFEDCGLAGTFDTLMQSHRHVRTYCDCFGHMLAAEGLVGAMVDFNIRIWDCMASVLIVEEAGGKAICVGKRVDGEQDRYDWVFGKPSVVDWVSTKLELVQVLL